ncbi:MAG: AlpA family transcriptional regulator [Thiotrichales bacterium]|nr:AlpA family transcriptional regulator [Thiotrichales bacterium]
MTNKVLRLPAVIEKTGLSRSSIYRLIQEGKFPPPVKLSARASAWFDDDINEWLNALPNNAASIYKDARRLLNKAGA